MPMPLLVTGPEAGIATLLEVLSKEWLWDLMVCTRDFVLADWLCLIAQSHQLSFILELLSKDQPVNRPMDIGTPYNAKHITHVGFDAKSGQFTGLPPDWQILLKHSGITEKEQQQHPQVKIN
jgi:hypothetical protein